MSAVDALRTGLRTLFDDPDRIGPHYLLAVGVTFAARTPILLGLGAALALLRAQGRIVPVVRRLERVNWQASTPTISPGLQEAVRGIVTPGTVLVGVCSVLAAVALLLVARGVAGAATLEALAAGIDDRDPLLAGTAGVGANWLSFVTLAVVRSAVLAGAAVAVFLGVGLTATGVGAVIGAPLLLLTVLLTPLVFLLLAFAGPAIAVDDVGAASALGRSVTFPFRQPVAVLLYVGVAVTAFVAVAACTVAFGYLAVPRVNALVILLGVNPIVDAIKVGLYAESRTEPAGESEWTFPLDGEPAANDAGPSSKPTPSSRRRDRVAAGIGRGLRELAGFVRQRPLLNAAAVATLLAGVGLGWLSTAPYGTQLPIPTDVRNVFGSVPVAAFANIAANNWLVAVAQGFGGVGLGVPTAANLLFNGVLIGGLAGVFDPTAFVALVVPHAVIEVPALGIAGGLGYHLGGVGYRALRGRASAEAVAAELQRAAWIGVGLGPVFVLAAFVEAFLTPAIAAMILGG